MDQKTNEVKTIKGIVTLPITEASKEHQKNINNFLSHESRRLHQYRSLKKLNDTLKLNELLAHIDFSENYSFKYGGKI